MSHEVFAMDTFFYNSLGAYDFDARCEMLKELGYNATYLTLWSEPAWRDVLKLAKVKDRYGLDVAAVWITLNISGSEYDEGNQRILRLLETLEGSKSVEVALVSGNASLRSSDPAGDKAAIDWLEKLLEIAHRRNLTILLYPHITHWMERIEDAVRLCTKVDHPALRVMFCGYHWYAVDGKNVQERLEEAAPFLGSVNLCGSRRVKNERGMPATIEPLDDGELDNFALLGSLRDIGYEGMIGLQGYSVGGDAYTNLERSINAFRNMEQRLEAYPHWARLRPIDST